MKYFTNIILLVFASCGFAMDQKLIDADVTYEKAEKVIIILQSKVYTIKQSLDYWYKELENETNLYIHQKNQRDFINKKLTNIRSSFKALMLKSPKPRICLKNLSH